MEILKPYDEIISTNKNLIILRSGRVAGKTRNSMNIVALKSLTGEGDIVLGRSNYNSLKTSLYNELIAVIDEEGLSQYFTFRTAPLSIYCKHNKNTIHFVGVGGSDLSRTKGFKPHKDLQIIMFDETQQLPDQNNLDQATATLFRFLKPDGQFILAFNPERQNMHWLNEYARAREDNSDWIILTATYKQIGKKLNDIQLRQIETERILNLQNYEYLYLAKTIGLFGSAYFTFSREKHYLPIQKITDKFKGNWIHTLIIGVDGASTRDKTALVPLAIMNNGQCVVLPIFYHDPIKNGALSNEELVPHILQWLKELEQKNGLVKSNTPIYFVCDAGGNSDLPLSLQYNLSSYYTIVTFGKKQVIPMAQNVQDVFSRNIMYIGDYGGYYSYPKERFIHESEEHYPIVTQLESVTWNEKGTGFDPIVPNDVTDALTYAVRWWFTNPDNLYLPEREEYYDMEVDN